MHGTISNHISLLLSRLKDHIANSKTFGLWALFLGHSTVKYGVVLGKIVILKLGEFSPLRCAEDSILRSLAFVMVAVYNSLVRERDKATKGNPELGEKDSLISYYFHHM